MNGYELIAWAHAVSTCMMAGLIWFVQVVHYPLFARVGSGSFEEYEGEHQRRTTLVVAPLMFTELATALMLTISPEPDAPGWAAPAGLALVVLIWISTAVVQVPLHRRLERAWDDRAHRALVATNWGRTALWSARVPIALLMLP